MYVRALRQYKEREGDCDVSGDHVEIVDGVSVKLGMWVSNVRNFKNGYSSYLLTVNRIKQLDEMEFVWDTYKYRFENNVIDIAEYYNKYGKYPSDKSKDLFIKKMGNFIIREKSRMRNENTIYPKWKTEILEKYLPDFSCETQWNKSVEEFIYYAKLYKKRYGHLNIKSKDIINGYQIGTKRSILSYSKLLSENQKKAIKDLGVYLGNKFQKQFDETILLAQQAVKNDVIVSSNNQKYKGKNLYDWILGTVKKRYRNKELSIEEIQIIEKLVGKSLEDLYCGKKEPVKVKVVDIIQNEEIGMFESQCETARRMQEKYDIKIADTVIIKHLTGKITKPYKGRFMFYRADENEEATE